MSIVDVRAERPYQVHVGPGVAVLLDEALGDAERVAVLYPEGLQALAERVVAGLSRAIVRIPLPDAEASKTPAVLARCWNALAEAGLTRSDAVVGIGGGATTDLAGFVAATWLRGVAYVSVPTSVLAMVDAAVGGKTGINLPSGKNLVGAFYEPSAVLCDLDLLAQLPPEELRPGLAEVVKAGFIADPAILGLFENDPEGALDPASSTLAELIVRAIAMKASVVGADFRESTSVGTHVGRELLNYGHTLGHAIERHEGYTWRHGNAISVGMVFAAELSRLAVGMPDALVARHRAILGSLGLPVSYPSAAWPALREAMNLDKKTRGSALRFVVLSDVAAASILKSPDERMLAEAFARIGR